MSREGASTRSTRPSCSRTKPCLRASAATSSMAGGARGRRISAARTPRPSIQSGACRASPSREAPRAPLPATRCRTQLRADGPGPAQMDWSGSRSWLNGHTAQKSVAVNTVGIPRSTQGPTTDAERRDRWTKCTRSGAKRASTPPNSAANSRLSYASSVTARWVPMGWGEWRKRSTGIPSYS
jgi:hypothetical protein